MLIIAENLNVRNGRYMNALRKFSPEVIQQLAGELIDAGADALNIQCSTDGAGDEVLLPKVAQAISQAYNTQLVLDSRNAEALKRAVPLCKVPPIINHLSIGAKNTDEIIGLCKENRCRLILRAMKDGIIPTSLDDRLQAIETLIEKANEAGISNEHLLADPSIVHLGQGMGQEYIHIYRDFIETLNELVDPPIGAISWISNVSTGSPRELWPRINSIFLAYLAGAGLKAALVDVLDPEMADTAYLLRVFGNEVVFSASEIHRKGLVTS